MAAMSLTCKVCKTDMTLQTLDPSCGEDGALKVTLIHLPAMVCPNMHRRFVKPEFPLMMLERIARKEMETLPAATSTGMLLFKKYRCGSCDGELEKGSGREESFDFDITLEDFPTFRVELTVPLHKCTACGKEQVRSRAEMQKLLAPAMARAFQAVGLKPD